MRWCPQDLITVYKHSHWGLGLNTGVEGDTNIQFTALFAYLFNAFKVK